MQGAVGKAKLVTVHGVIPSAARQSRAPMRAASATRHPAEPRAAKALPPGMWGALHQSLSTLAFRSSRQPSARQQMRRRIFSQDGRQSGEANAAAESRHSTALYIPNIVTYLRLAVVIFGCFLPPLGFACCYLAAAALDGVDGVLARRLNQQSRLGAFLDVAVDNVSRAVMWAKAAPGPLAAAVPCLEWAVFLSTHTLSEGSAVWKSAEGGVFHRAPPLMLAVMKDNFKTPLGALAVLGLHFAPFWLWLNSLSLGGAASAAFTGHLPAATVQQLWVTLGAALLLGRALALVIEGWILLRYLGLLATADAPPRGRPGANGETQRGRAGAGG